MKCERSRIWCVLWVTVLLPLLPLAACRGTDLPTDETAATTAPKTSPVTETAAAVMIPDAAVGKPVTSTSPPNALYPAKGLESLVDGKMGSDDYQDLEWMGWWYEDEPFEVTIDLGKLVAIREVGVHTLTSSEFWILYPRKVEFELSKDGQTFEKLGAIAPTEAELKEEFPASTTLKASNLTHVARYVRVRAQRYGELPKTHIGHGGADGYEGEAWLFIDEILVNPK